MIRGQQNNQVILALPSKGEIAEPTIEFLANCGFKVTKTNPRQYTAHMPALPQVTVLFQRAWDIAAKVVEGSADLGITGLDVVLENSRPGDDLIILHENLNYGHCDLVVAVPETWIDVDSLGDIADVALDFREKKGRDLRVATKFPNLVRQFFHDNGIAYFALVPAAGAIEAAPTFGYADIIADLTSTGTTLRENHLKPVDDGTILHSQACLIGHKRSLMGRETVLHTTKTLLEHIDGVLEARKYYSVTANVQGPSADEIAERVSEQGITLGLQDPTITPVYSLDRSKPSGGNWYAVTIIVSRSELLKAVERLRSIGGSHIVATPLTYVFSEESESYSKLSARLKRERP